MATWSADLRNIYTAMITRVFYPHCLLCYDVSCTIDSTWVITFYVMFDLMTRNSLIDGLVCQLNKCGEVMRPASLTKLHRAQPGCIVRITIEHDDNAGIHWTFTSSILNANYWFSRLATSYSPLDCFVGSHSASSPTRGRCRWAVALSEMFSPILRHLL